ncbi:Fic family protein [Candidatus Pacearchaeota archaeon CG10_big_fil_rev_8_21_14_0_10_34_76]|nr:MAG: Fic family protein [Candidatus Pacearchaeota archaeon CG10_big_fil_rev_8_21_14_0_10_34_76]
MHLEKRKVGSKTKYYLAHSFREGGKVHKIRKFLGSNLSPGLLDERNEIAKKLIFDEINQHKIIQNPLDKELSKREIGFVKKIEAKIDFKITHLSEKNWEKFSELFTYNTNAIEGSELTRGEVKEILEEDKWPEKKSKSDIAEAYGVDEAIKYIRKTKEHISIDLIRKMHEIVFKNSKNFAGRFREEGEEVVIKTKSGEIVHEGAPASRVRSLLKELIEWYDKHRNRYSALILAAVVHNQFEIIHPFADGNGRVGRLLMNNILIKHSLPPINIQLKNVREYYESLQAYQKRKDLRPTMELMLKEYKEFSKMLK